MACASCGQRYKNSKKGQTVNSGLSRGRPYVRRIRTPRTPLQINTPTSVESTENTEQQPTS